MQQVSRISRARRELLEGDPTRDPEIDWDLERPWLRQPCDTEREFHYFAKWLNRIPPRCAPRGPILLASIEKHWDWRAEQYDKALYEIARMQHVNRVMMSEDVAHDMTEAGWVEIKAIREAQKQSNGALGTLRPAEALRFAERGIRLAADLAGAPLGFVPSAPVRPVVAAPTRDLSKLTPAQLEAWRAAEAVMQGERVAEVEDDLPPLNEKDPET